MSSKGKSPPRAMALLPAGCQAVVLLPLDVCRLPERRSHSFLLPPSNTSRPAWTQTSPGLRGHKLCLLQKVPVYSNSVRSGLEKVVRLCSTVRQGKPELWSRQGIKHLCNYLYSQKSQNEWARKGRLPKQWNNKQKITDSASPSATHNFTSPKVPKPSFPFVYFGLLRHYW